MVETFIHVYIELYSDVPDKKDQPLVHTRGHMYKSCPVETGRRKGGAYAEHAEIHRGTGMLQHQVQSRKTSKFH